MIGSLYLNLNHTTIAFSVSTTSTPAAAYSIQHTATSLQETLSDISSPKPTEISFFVGVRVISIGFWLMKVC
jgi:hypothetical protein